MAADLPEGIIIPLIIPFQADGEVDRSMLQQLTSFNVKAKVQGLFALGSAGQGAVMTPDQRRSALETIMEVAGGQIPVIAHVGTSESYSGRELARHAAGCGVDALAIIPPYYYSDHSEYEIQRHFCEVAEGAPELPPACGNCCQTPGESKSHSRGWSKCWATCAGCQTLRCTRVPSPTWWAGYHLVWRGPSIRPQASFPSYAFSFGKPLQKESMGRPLIFSLGLTSCGQWWAISRTGSVAAPSPRSCGYAGSQSSVTRAGRAIPSLRKNVRSCEKP